MRTLSSLQMISNSADSGYELVQVRNIMKVAGSKRAETAREIQRIAQHEETSHDPSRFGIDFDTSPRPTIQSRPPTVAEFENDHSP